MPTRLPIRMNPCGWLAGIAGVSAIAIGLVIPALMYLSLERRVGEPSGDATAIAYQSLSCTRSQQRS